MSSLANLYEKLSLSRQELAQWIGLTTAELERYEQGTSYLPVPAQLQLNKLEMLLQQINPEPSEPSNNITGMHTRIQQHIRETIRLRNQLAALQARHAALAQQIGELSRKMEDHRQEKTEKALSWLKILHWQLSSLQTKFDEQHQGIIK